jgi:anti-sigma regulatory factor (Ser/Thr protein kinase)
MQPSVLRHTLQASPGAVREARRLVVEFVQRECRGSAEIESAVALTVSEAVGNVVRHAYQDRRAGPVELVAELDGEDTVVVCVRDEGAGLGGRLRQPGLGLGLRIMRAMAETKLEALPDGGCQVSLRFPCPSHDR